jgi:hypothetical protein
VNACRRRLDRIKLQRRLACRGPLDVDRGQQLGVEQRAVLRAPGAINAIARAQIVKRVVSAGVLASRQHQRVDDALGAIGGLAARFSSALRKAISKP